MIFCAGAKPRRSERNEGKENMTSDYILILSREFNLRPEQIKAVIELLDAGNTIPFIARYRKEQHGELDDTKLRSLEERLQQLRNLEQRRNEISESLKKLDKWTEELQAEHREEAELFRYFLDLCRRDHR